LFQEPVFLSGEQIVESFDAFVEEILTRGEGVHPIFYDSRGTSGEIFKPFAKDVANTDILLIEKLKEEKTNPLPSTPDPKSDDPLLGKTVSLEG